MSVTKEQVKVVRNQTCHPKDWWEAFAEHAASRGMSLSAWMGMVCARALPPDVRRKLSERPASRYVRQAKRPGSTKR
jgi:hypothetical protein